MSITTHVYYYAIKICSLFSALICRLYFKSPDDTVLQLIEILNWY